MTTRTTADTLERILARDSAQNPGKYTVEGERLALLADALDTLPPERWDIEVDISDDGSKVGPLGVAAEIPELTAAGYRLDDDGAPTLGALRYYDAACALFGISVSSANYLFDAPAYEPDLSASAVACRIRDFVRAHRCPPPDYSPPHLGPR